MERIIEMSECNDVKPELHKLGDEQPCLIMGMIGIIDFKRKALECVIHILRESHYKTHKIDKEEDLNSYEIKDVILETIEDEKIHAFSLYLAPNWPDNIKEKFKKMVDEELNEVIVDQLREEE